MKMDKVAGSGNDEFYTPAYAVRPIMRYIPAESTIWCPFDSDDSLFVKLLEGDGHKVLFSHISNGVDFFSTEPPDGTEYIVSNPPYSLKNEVFERLFQLNIPFAMLVGVVGLFESQRRFQLFKNNEFEVMYLSKRVSYMQDFCSGKTAMNPPFSSVYLCHKMLPQPIIFEEIEKKEVLPEVAA